MAGIDKTYTDSYKDYKEFKDWADNQTLTYFNGHKVCIGDWVWKREKEDFSNGEIPIMNTPTWIDIYLIQNCKIGFILNRMKSIYGKESYKEFQSIDLTATPSRDFKQKRKITIKRSDRTKFPLHTKPYGGKTKWWLQCNDNFGYCDVTNVWSSCDNYYPQNSNTTNIKSIKGVVRHLRKQYLPKGIIFNLIGRYVGEDYLVVVS
jgi:hypothetical protein